MSGAAERPRRDTWVRIRIQDCRDPREGRVSVYRATRADAVHVAVGSLTLVFVRGVYLGSARITEVPVSQDTGEKRSFHVVDRGTGK